MAAQQPGFLQSLGVSPVDEKDAVTAQRDALLNKVEQARTAQGKTAGRSVAGLLGGVISLVKNRSFRGVGTAIGKAHAQATDRDVAQASGLTVEQLRGRREMRSLSSKGSAEGSFEDRISLARKIADIANRSGDSDVLGASLKRITDLRTEQTEFAKLQAKKTVEESAATDSDVRDAFLDGKAVSGTDAEDQNGVKGLNIADEAGNIVFMPWGERLFRDDGNARTPEESIVKFVSASERKKVSGLITVGASHLRKSRRVMAMLVDASKIGNLQETIGNSGKMLEWMDNTTRNLKGIVGVTGKSFKSQDVASRTARHRDGAWKGVAGWFASADSGREGIWDSIALPEWAQQSASQAALYRSQILDMAYMAARLAEPSNRGLSDKDIEAALLKIAGNSANPAVIMARFSEHIFDGAASIQVELSRFYGAFTGVNDQDVDSFFGGRALTDYRSELTKFSTDFGFTVDRNGRITFEDPLDVIQQPLPLPGDDSTDNTGDLLPAEQNISQADIDEFFGNE